MSDRKLKMLASNYVVSENSVLKCYLERKRIIYKEESHMKRARKELQPGDRVFVGIDIHKKKWHVTARTAEFELFSGSIPGCG